MRRESTTIYKYQTMCNRPSCRYMGSSARAFGPRTDFFAFPVTASSMRRALVISDTPNLYIFCGIRVPNPSFLPAFVRKAPLISFPWLTS